MRLLFSGDFAPKLKAEDLGKEYFTDIQGLLHQCDLHITNLECPLTRAKEPIEKTGPPIKAHPKAVQLLRQANVSIACLANNHIFDYGEAGLKETLYTCHTNQIETIGVVNQPDKKDRWQIKEVRGKRVGFLNYCEHEYSVRGDGLLGASGYDCVNAYYDIQGLRPQVDQIVVIYHGGNEYYPLPNPEIKKHFRYLADLGADIVVGHHAHVFSGFEWYKGKPLIYSLGNFFFPENNEPDEWYVGMTCLIHTHSSGLPDVRFFPCQLDKHNHNLTLPSESEGAVIKERMNQLSAIIQDDKMLQSYWEAFALKEGRNMVKMLLHSSKPERLLFRYHWTRRGMEKVMNSKKRRLAINNLLRCQSIRYLMYHNFNQK